MSDPRSYFYIGANPVAGCFLKKLSPAWGIFYLPMLQYLYMYEQDIIFGPLTFKQFVAILVGVILSFLIYKNLEQNYILIGIIILSSLYFAFFVFKNKKIPLDQIERYFAIKKSELSVEEYEKIIRQKIANIESQIEFRKQGGLGEDLRLVEVLNIFKRL